MSKSPSGKIRLGIMGASVMDEGRKMAAWASAAHIPALKALPEYELVAVASRSQDNANAAAAAFGIPHAYGDYQEMVRRPDLDMIIVSTSSAYHHSFVMPAIEAGKHVFCEWPFGTDMKQALEMRDAAKKKGMRTLVGLQTRYAPIVAYVRDLIAEGYIGKLYSVNLDRANDQSAQKNMTAEYLEFLEKANAGLRIMVGHGMDTLAAYVGELVDLQSYMETGMNQIKLNTGEMAPVKHKDQILIQGRLNGGAVVDVVMKQNSPTYKPMHLEMSGSGGAIVVTTTEDIPTAARHPGIPYNFMVLGTPALGQPFKPLPVPEKYSRVPDSLRGSQGYDVAHMYKDFAAALANGTPCETDFDHGVKRHRLLEAIVAAAESGQRQKFNAASK